MGPYHAPEGVVMTYGKVHGSTVPGDHGSTSATPVHRRRAARGQSVGASETDSSLFLDRILGPGCTGAPSPDGDVRSLGPVSGKGYRVVRRDNRKVS